MLLVARRGYPLSQFLFSASIMVWWIPSFLLSFLFMFPFQLPSPFPPPSSFSLLWDLLLPRFNVLAQVPNLATIAAYLRESSRVTRRCPFIYLKLPYAIGPVPSLSGYAIAYRWRSLPRVRRDRASKPQGSSERVLPGQVTMYQLIWASLSHTHYWYEVGMLQ